MFRFAVTTRNRLSVAPPLLEVCRQVERHNCRLPGGKLAVLAVPAR